ncbi:MAG: T9SS type A sorting domain-containing protein [Flavobacteriales bacterium]|jgi:hypothetical protein
MGYINRLFLTAMVPLVAIGFAQAQFKAIPDSNASWMASWWPGPGYDVSGYFFQYDSIDPDTLIDGEVFKKLIGPGGIGSSYYSGALRDNGLGQVFYCDVGSDPALLCDFDVVPGDTVFNVFSWWHEDVVVQDVDTIMVNGTHRKRIALACPTSPGWAAAYWIQGIGSTGGFYFTNTCGSVSGDGTLVCMTVNDTVQFGANVGEIGSCEIYLGVNETNHKVELTAKPNPSLGLFTIDTGGERVIRCTLFDFQGREVMEVTGNEVDLSNSMPGIYSAVVVTEQGRYHMQLEVIH